MTVKATLLRAAAIIEKITANDVADMQVELLRAGVPLSRVALLDRALLASYHLRACAELGKDANETAAQKYVFGLLRESLLR